MDKRGIFDDWADVTFSVLLVGIIFLSLFIFIRAENENINAAAISKDKQLRSDTMLLNFLRTPVSKSNPYPKFDAPYNNDKNYRTIIDNLINYSVSNNLIVSDLFRMIESNKAYLQIIISIARNDEYLSKQATITADITPVFYTSTYTVGTVDIIRNPCLGEVSTAYIPVQDKNPISVAMIAC